MELVFDWKNTGDEAFAIVFEVILNIGASLWI